MLRSLFGKFTTKPRRHNWIEDRSGGTALMLGILFPVLVLAAGGAIDVQRAIVAKQHMQDALDATLLSASGSYIESGQIDQAGFRSALEKQSKDVDRLTLQTSSAWGSNNRTISAYATADVGNYFLSIFGRDIHTITVNSEVSYDKFTPTEVGLAIDISGSLFYSGAHDDLSDALQVFLNTIHPAGEEDMENLFVGFVPFAGPVNVGGDKQSWLKSYAPSAFQPGAWSGCTLARNIGDDITDTPPTGANRFEAFLWSSSPAINDWAASGVSSHKDIRLKANYLSDLEHGPNAGCSQELLSLTNKRSDVEAAIATYSTHVQGSVGTFLTQGMVWGHRMLSPRWKGLWGGPTPPTAPSENAKKYLIFLTDGVSNWNEYGLAAEHYSPLGSSTENRLGLADPGSHAEFQNAESARFLLACEEAKANGITVYTIGYAMSSGGAEMLRGCATDDAHFLGNPSVSEIRDTLGGIASQIVRDNTLRISG